MTVMRKVAALLAFAICAFISGGAQPPEGRPVPPFSLPTLDGGKVTVKVERDKRAGRTALMVLLRRKVKGKWVERRLPARALLVIHWASWNPFSVRLLQKFAPLCRRFAKRGLVAVAVNLFDAQREEGAKRVEGIVKGTPYIVALDPLGLTAKPCRVSELPVTTLVDSNGIVKVTRSKCYPGILDEFERWLSGLLGPPPRPKGKGD